MHFFNKYTLLNYFLLSWLISCNLITSNTNEQSLKQAPKIEPQKKKLDTVKYLPKLKDNLASISQKFDLRPTEIINLNPKLEIVVEPGDEITISNKLVEKKKHILLVGQNLHTLSAIYGVSIDDLLLENPNVIVGIDTDDTLVLHSYVNSDDLLALNSVNDSILFTKEETEYLTAEVSKNTSSQNIKTNEIPQKQETSIDNLINENTATVQKPTSTWEDGELVVQSNRLKTVIHKAESRDNTKELAKLYNTTEEKIIEANPQLKNNPIKSGDLIQITSEINPPKNKLVTSANFNAIFSSQQNIKNNIVYGLNRGKDIKYTYTLFEHNLVTERVYRDKRGLHKVFKISSQNNRHLFDVFSECKNPARCIIQKIVIRDAVFKTKEGAHVGSSIKEIKKIYTNPKVTIIDGGVVLLPSENNNIALVVEGFSMEWKADGNYNVTDIPETLKIASIHVF